MVTRKRNSPATPVAEVTGSTAPATPVQEQPAVPEVVPTVDAVKSAAKVGKEAKEKPVEKVEKEKSDKPARKPKVVRDSFTMPESDYARLAELKKRTLSVGVSSKKSELLRAGLQALSQLTPAELASVISQLESVKTGRPASEKKAA